MTAITDQPKNINLLTDVQFRFDIEKLPATSFMVQNVVIPGMQVQAQQIGVPMRANFSRNTGVIEYEPFVVTYLVDEYLTNWQELHGWMTKEGGVHSQAVLTVLSSSMNPTVEVHFQDIFPFTMTELTFDSTAGEPTYIQCSVTFYYKEFTIKNLLNT
jgi:hypothetical protein